MIQINDNILTLVKLLNSILIFFQILIGYIYPCYVTFTRLKRINIDYDGYQLAYQILTYWLIVLVQCILGQLLEDILVIVLFRQILNLCFIINLVKDNFKASQLLCQCTFKGIDKVNQYIFDKVELITLKIPITPNLGVSKVMFQDSTLSESVKFLKTIDELE